MKVKLFYIFFLASTARCVHGDVFPYAEFLGLTGQPGIHMKNMMEMYYLCSSPTKQEFMMQCDCSPNCMKFHSCCMDHLWEPNRKETLENYTDRFLSEAEKHVEMDCYPILKGLPENRGYTVEAILLRSKCPSGFRQELFDKCETTIGRQSVRPVIGNDGNVYKNKYCAICNDKAEFNGMNISAKQCVTNTTLPNATTSFFDRNTNCKFELAELKTEKSEEKSLRTCNIKSDQINGCKTTNTKTCRLCSSYVSGFSYVGGVGCYKNFHCFMGSTERNADVNIITNTLQICLDYVIKTRSSNTPDLHSIGLGWSPSDSISYSMLVSFNDLGKKQCKGDQLYDDVSNQCITDVVCGPGYSQVGTSCKRNTAYPSGNMINEFSEEEPFCLSDAVFITIKLKKKTSARQNTTRNIEERFPTNVLYRSQAEITFQLKANNSDLELLLRNLSYHYEPHQIRSTVPDHYVTELYGLDFSRTFPNGKFCAVPLVSRDVVVDSTESCKVNFNNTVLFPNDYIINVYRNRSRDERSHVELITCQEFHLQSTCLKRIIPRFESLPANNRGKVVAEGRVYQAIEYLPMATGIAVCISEPRTKQVHGWERVVNGVDHYITLVGCVCSIICYVWVMLTYTIIPALKTIPGKNIVCLCFALMFCDILMLSGSSRLEYKVCAAFGVLLHYFALSAQFWAGIVAFDIWSTFHSRSIIRDVKSQKRFKLYLICGFLFPALLISTFAVLEFTRTVDFGYGLNGVCWITKFYPRLGAYIIPMAIIALLNIVALSYTIYCIYKHARKSKKLLKKSGGESMSLARMSLKLIVLLGAIEILGLVQTSGNSTDGEKLFNAIFQVIYSSVRAFRGVFIWLLYIVTDRVLNVYRDIKSQRSLYTRSSIVSQSTQDNIRRKSSSKRLMETSCSV